MPDAPTIVVDRHDPLTAGAACSVDAACQPAASTTQPDAPSVAAATTTGQGIARPARSGRTPLLAGLAAAVACLACLVPGLAAGGAGVLAVGALEPDELVMGGLALVLLTIASVSWLRRRQRRAAGDACGC